MEQRGDLPQELEDIPRPPKKAKREYNSTAMDITIMDSCCSKASPAPKGQGVETDQDVPTSHGTEAQQRPASSPEALQQLRESLKPKFESVDTDGGMPIVFELPNGEKLTYNTDIMSCSTKMLYEYVFYAGLVNQRFRIFSGPARRPIPCNHSKISEINFLSHLLFVVEYEEGDILEFLQTVEEK
ncbi:hypothetical protein GBAR_LOCUS24703 [Geodia barretti]|uniref:UBX domain-containing protein n=1 Tax=Geodia barretti TaxID=519541 RepID=A0AA35X406_GEOBA|nr:hypothetical protein GBAR_LOCUS24703 [Geodia barretti]